MNTHDTIVIQTPRSLEDVAIAAGQRLAVEWPELNVKIDYRARRGAHSIDIVVPDAPVTLDAEGDPYSQYALYTSIEAEITTAAYEMGADNPMALG